MKFKTAYTDLIDEVIADFGEFDLIVDEAARGVPESNDDVSAEVQDSVSIS